MRAIWHSASKNRTPYRHRYIENIHMAITIQPVSDKKELKKFVRFPIDLYKGNPYYIPPLIFDEIGTLIPEKNPAFDICEAAYFMAYRDGKPVGRIAGIINRQVNEKNGTKEARFGFVDFIDDSEVSEALFKTVEEWARSKGMDTLDGPLGFTDMDYEGMLIEGFDQLGTISTIYNHPYYPEHLQRMGYLPLTDWVEYKIYVPDAIPEKHQRISDMVRRKYNLRNIKFTKTSDIVRLYGKQIFELINEAYKDLFGYSTLTPRQIDYYIKMYLPMVRLENVSLIIDADDRLVGVGIAIPSMAKAFQKARGKLFPFGFIHVLKALKGKNDVVDLLLVAIHPNYQNKGVNALLFSDLIPVFIRNGYRYAESNPELEENEKVQSQWQYFHREQHKRRRAFRKKL